MLTLFRAGLAAALMAFAVLPSLAADNAKPYQNSDHDDDANKHETQINQDAGTVTKSAASLR